MAGTSHDRLPEPFTKKQNEWCDLAVYSLSRPGSLRRRLGIVNPIPYFRLARFIVEHQTPLLKKASSSKLALGKVVVDRSGLNRSAHLDDVPHQRAMVRIGEHFLLTADVSRFYPSIYTHSIDWAITSKARAKRQLKTRQGKRSIGATIDRLVQACQSGQTRGIPIGPATSLLLAEILLGRVDARLRSKGVSTGFRFADDYELIFNERSQAERALATLEDALSEFELELNPAKTKIIELPQELDNPGIQELRGFRFRSSRAEKSDLLHFFSRAFALHEKFPETTILRYAVSRLSPTRTKPNNAALFQSLVLQAVTYEPGVWQMAIKQLLTLRTTYSDLSKAEIGQTIHSMIRKCAHMNHTSEIAWSLWAALVFEIKLSRTAVRAVSRMMDDCCSILLFHAAQNGLTPSKPAQRTLARWMVPEALRAQHWLLSYELAVKRWINLPKVDHISHDPAFEFLRNANVEFYDPTELDRTVGQEEEEEEVIFAYGL
jgi:hypothetical protein